MHEVQFTLGLSIVLVILVVFLFFRDVRTTLIPSVAVPVSLVGTFGVMYLLGYSVDNLSLMALTIATGFVVDDTIVVIENIMRYLEQGMPPRQAALRGAKEIGFTVVSITISLLAVFIPILLMRGIFGRLFREFAVTLSIAVAISLVVSLTTTPMMCAYLLRAPYATRNADWLYRASERVFQGILRLYEITLGWVLRHHVLMLLVTLGDDCVSIHLYGTIPQGFFPAAGHGRAGGHDSGRPEQLFPGHAPMAPPVRHALSARIRRWPMSWALPAAALVRPIPGACSWRSNRSQSARFSADEVITRLRGKTARVPGARLVMQASQDLRMGGRQSGAQYQFTLAGR